MTKPPGVKRNFLHQILKTVEEHGEHHLRSAKEDQVSAVSGPGDVLQSTTALGHHVALGHDHLQHSDSRLLIHLLQWLIAAVLSAAMESTLQG